MASSHFAIFKLVIFQGLNYIIASPKRDKVKWFFFQSATTSKKLLVVTRIILTL